MGIRGKGVGQVDLDTQELFYKRIAARTLVGLEMLTGIHHLETQSYLDEMTDNLIVELNALVVAQEAGPTQTFTHVTRTTFRYTAPRKPWWVSKRRWAKWPCDVVEVPRELIGKVEVTPEYIYPDCSRVFPKGERVMRVVTPRESWKVEDYRP